MAESTEDKLLLRKMAGGDRNAFRAFYARHEADLYRYAMALLGVEDLAKESMQDFFLKVWQNPKVFEGAFEFKTYFFRAFRNMALDLLRKRRSENKKTAALFKDQSPFLVPGLKDGDEESRKILDEALSALSPDMREIILLHLYQDFAFRDIEIMTGIPRATVYDKYKKALNELKRKLNFKEVQGGNP